MTILEVNSVRKRYIIKILKFQAFDGDSYLVTKYEGDFWMEE